MLFGRFLNCKFEDFLECIFISEININKIFQDTGSWDIIIILPFYLDNKLYKIKKSVDDSYFFNFIM